MQTKFIGKAISISVFFLFSTLCNAQEEKTDTGKHRITLALGHANVSQGIKDGDTKWLSIPSWGIDYDYWLSDKWAIGLHTDIIIEDFKVKASLSSEEETLERSSPVAPAFVGIFKPTKHSSFLLGAGAEFAKEENLFLNRVGYEWGTEINESWELGISLCYDFRWNAYDSYLIGIGISRIIRSKHK